MPTASDAPTLRTAAVLAPLLVLIGLPQVKYPWWTSGLGEFPAALLIFGPAILYALLALPLVALLRHVLPGLWREASFVFVILWIWNVSLNVTFVIGEFAWIAHVRSGGA